MDSYPPSRTDPLTTGTEQVTIKNPDPDHKKKKPGLFARYLAKRHGKDVMYTDEELLQYTGKNRVQLEKMAEMTDGVGKNQVANSVAGSQFAMGTGGVGMGLGTGKLKFPKQT